MQETGKRSVSESYEERIANKIYRMGSEDLNDSIIDLEREQHERLMEEEDQTWYFALADCEGRAELFRDEETQKDHLLGLYDRTTPHYQKLKEKKDAIQTERGEHARRIISQPNNPQLDQEILDRQLKIEKEIKEDEDDDGSEERDEEETFNFDEYKDDHRLNTLVEFALYSSSRQLTIKSVPL
jgi:hypothetical protein